MLGIRLLLTGTPSFLAFLGCCALIRNIETNEIPQCACREGHVAVAKLFVTCGADVMAKTTEVRATNGPFRALALGDSTGATKTADKNGPAVPFLTTPG